MQRFVSFEAVLKNFLVAVNLGAIIFVTFCGPHIVGCQLHSSVHSNKAADWLSEEVCETEAFNVTCPPSEVIVLTRALYGRMRIGRCVKVDYGHVGCYTDVLGLADVMCSGRHHCVIRIPEATFARHTTCPDDLKPYLEITYTCLPVITPPVGDCQTQSSWQEGEGQGHPIMSVLIAATTSSHHQQQQGSGRSGFLASVVTQVTSCGGPTHPWIVQARPGQTLNITLYDFYAFARRSIGSSYHQLHQSQQGHVTTTSLCDVYVTIRELTWPRSQNVTVCGSDVREKPVFLSKSPAVEITLMTSSTTSSSSLSASSVSSSSTTASLQYYFLLKYEVLGCADTFSATMANARSQRTGNKLVVTCTHSPDIYQLTCLHGNWVGLLGNCSQRALSVRRDADITQDFEDQEYDLSTSDFDYVPYGLSILVVLAIALLIGLSVLGIGLVVLKRRMALYLPSPTNTASSNACVSSRSHNEYNATCSTPLTNCSATAAAAARRLSHHTPSSLPPPRRSFSSFFARHQRGQQHQCPARCASLDHLAGCYYPSPTVVAVTSGVNNSAQVRHATPQVDVDASSVVCGVNESSGLSTGRVRPTSGVYGVFTTNSGVTGVNGILSKSSGVYGVRPTSGVYGVNVTSGIYNVNAGVCRVNGVSTSSGVDDVNAITPEICNGVCPSTGIYTASGVPVVTMATMGGRGRGRNQQNTSCTTAVCDTVAAALPKMSMSRPSSNRNSRPCCELLQKAEVDYSGTGSDGTFTGACTSSASQILRSSDVGVVGSEPVYSSTFKSTTTTATTSATAAAAIATTASVNMDEGVSCMKQTEPRSPSPQFVFHATSVPPSVTSGDSVTYNDVDVMLVGDEQHTSRLCRPRCNQQRVLRTQTSDDALDI